MLGKGVMKCMREFVCLLLQQIEGEVEGGWQAHLKCALDPLTCLLSPFKISTQLFSRFYRVASWPRVSLVSRGVGGNLFASNLKIGNLYLCICEFAYLSALLAAVWRKSASQQSQNWETAAISLSFFSSFPFAQNQEHIFYCILFKLSIQVHIYWISFMFGPRRSTSLLTTFNFEHLVSPTDVGKPPPASVEGLKLVTLHRLQMICHKILKIFLTRFWKHPPASVSQ